MSRLSIMRILWLRCGEAENPLSRPLRYCEDASEEKREKEAPKLRTRAVRRMLSMLSAAGFVSSKTDVLDEGSAEEREEVRYSVVNSSLKLPDFVSKITLKSVARRLGFRVEGSKQYDVQIKRILEANRLDSAFLEGLTHRPLPLHLRRLCSDHVIRTFGSQQNTWPMFLDPDAP